MFLSIQPWLACFAQRSYCWCTFHLVSTRIPMPFSLNLHSRQSVLQLIPGSLGIRLSISFYWTPKVPACPFLQPAKIHLKHKIHPAAQSTTISCSLPLLPNCEANVPYFYLGFHATHSHSGFGSKCYRLLISWVEYVNKLCVIRPWRAVKESWNKYKNQLYTFMLQAQPWKNEKKRNQQKQPTWG